MEKLNNYELMNITGGGISGTLINSIIKGINLILDISRALGTAIRRIGSKSICKI